VGVCGSPTQLLRVGLSEQTRNFCEFFSSSSLIDPNISSVTFCRGAILSGRLLSRKITAGWHYRNLYVTLFRWFRWSCTNDIHRQVDAGLDTASRERSSTPTLWRRFLSSSPAAVTLSSTASSTKTTVSTVIIISIIFICIHPQAMHSEGHFHHVSSLQLCWWSVTTWTQPARRARS